jgi:hypothetical protein
VDEKSQRFGATRSVLELAVSRECCEISLLAIDAFAHFPSVMIMSRNAWPRARCAARSISGVGQSSFENLPAAPKFRFPVRSTILASLHNATLSFDQIRSASSVRFPTRTNLAKKICRAEFTFTIVPSRLELHLGDLLAVTEPLIELATDQQISCQDFPICGRLLHGSGNQVVR